MLLMRGISLRSLMCLMSSEGSDPLVALEYSLDLIRSNMGAVVNKKFKIKNKCDELDKFRRRVCLKHELCWWRKCRNFF
jgi:hypothetical protein